MKVTEIRIGNYVDKIPYRGQDSNETRKDWIIGSHDIGFWHTEEFIYKPIPLTTEWLEKFGFERHSEIGHSHYFKDADYSIDIEHPGDDIYMYLKTRKVKLKYVHQLQNLYFCLTNEELKIMDNI